MIGHVATINNHLVINATERSHIRVSIISFVCMVVNNVQNDLLKKYDYTINVFWSRMYVKECPGKKIYHAYKMSIPQFQHYVML